MSTQVFVDPEISTQADGAQSSRVPIPLSEDPYRAIRQAYLVGTDTEFEPIETEAPESPHTVASPTSLPDSTPPTCYDEELEGSDTSSARSTSSDSTAPLLPNHPLTHDTPTLVTVLRRTARMVVRIPPAMSQGLFASMAEVAAMSDSAFRKRFWSSYESSPSSSPPDLPSWKRYRGTFELVEADEEGDDEEEDEEIEESSNFDSVSEDAEDDGPIAEDEDPVAGDEGLATGDEGPGIGVESPSLGGDEAVPGGQQRAAPVAETVMGEPLGLGYRALRRWERAGCLVYLSSLPISPAPSIIPSPISSPMISLTVPSPVASPATTKTEGFLTELGARVEMQGGLIRDHTRYRFRSLEHEQERVAVTFGAIWRPVLALESWAARKGETYAVGVG
ncbi:hypothetical protein Tco_0392599 [Tanacetum coccineum]